jgi:hypothetical protein
VEEGPHTLAAEREFGTFPVIDFEGSTSFAAFLADTILPLDIL